MSTSPLVRLPVVSVELQHIALELVQTLLEAPLHALVSRELHEAVALADARLLVEHHLGSGGVAELPEVRRQLLVADRPGQVAHVEGHCARHLAGHLAWGTLAIASNGRLGRRLAVCEDVWRLIGECYKEDSIRLMSSSNGAPQVFLIPNILFQIK